jgi:hypothetical protein
MIAAGLPACTDTMPGQVCTALFAYVQVTVQTAGGVPIGGLTISDTVLRNGAGFVVPQSVGGAMPGTYVIMDDDFRDRLQANGDAVRVTGYENGTVFTADYVFDVPDGCHIRKVSGPGIVVP